MNVGDRIRLYRKKENMSQEELAWIANITPAYLGQVERGLKSPTITVLNKVTAALNISLAELFAAPSDPLKDKTATMRRIELQLSGLTEEDLERVSAIIENIIEIKASRT